MRSCWIGNQLPYLGYTPWGDAYLGYTPWGDAYLGLMKLCWAENHVLHEGCRVRNSLVSAYWGHVRSCWAQCGEISYYRKNLNESGCWSDQSSCWEDASSNAYWGPLSSCWAEIHIRHEGGCWSDQSYYLGESGSLSDYWGKYGLDVDC